VTRDSCGHGLGFRARGRRRHWSRRARRRSRATVTVRLSQHAAAARRPGRWAAAVTPGVPSTAAVRPSHVPASVLTDLIQVLHRDRLTTRTWLATVVMPWIITRAGLAAWAPAPRRRRGRGVARPESEAAGPAGGCLRRLASLRLGAAPPAVASGSCPGAAAPAAADQPRTHNDTEPALAHPAAGGRA
jgi:hypothetical protein